jgi:hypothetical protein
MDGLSAFAGAILVPDGKVTENRRFGRELRQRPASLCRAGGKPLPVRVRAWEKFE